MMALRFLWLPVGCVCRARCGEGRIIRRRVPGFRSFSPPGNKSTCRYFISDDPSSLTFQPFPVLCMPLANPAYHERRQHSVDPITPQAGSIHAPRHAAAAAAAPSSIAETTNSGSRPSIHPAQAAEQATMHLRLQANPALRHCFAVLPAAYADRLRAESATAVRAEALLDRSMYACILTNPCP